MGRALENGAETTTACVVTLKPMRHAWLGALLVIIPLAAQAAPARRGPALTAEGVLQRLSRKDAATLVEELYASEATWNQVLRGVRSGDAGWLKVARRLKQPSGSTAAELTAAMAEALAVAPARVLAQLGEEFDPDDVCSLNTLEDTLGDSYAAAVRKVAAREKAVRAVKDATVTTQRDDCLGFLHELAGEVERNRAEWFPKP